MKTLAAVLLVAAAAQSAAAADDMVPFVIPQTPNPASLIALKSPPIPVDAAPLEARDGHFWAGQRRVRVWGVNLCFGASFPTHADAERMAARLAAAGVNSVRFHHMDTSRVPIRHPRPQGPDETLGRGPRAAGLSHRPIGPPRRVRQHQPARRPQPQAPPWACRRPAPSTTRSWASSRRKLIEAQKQYARDLLGHVNAYRKVRYADDPAVGFVEITNEDSFFMWDGEERLRALPEFYAKVLRGQYAAWLKTRYKDTAGLGEAWSKRAEPLGDNHAGGRWS